MQRKQIEIVPREEIPWLENDQVIECETCLPYPYVHYPPRISGAFFGFQENQNSPLYFCSCQKEGIEQVLSSEETRNRNAFPRIIGDVCSFDFRYKETLCHICNQIPPTYAYAPLAKTLSKFRSIYGYYILGKTYERNEDLRLCENIIRNRIGYYEIGKKWTQEAKLLELVKKVFPDYTIIHQYPLSHLRVDIYIQELKLVIEYQGEQHFKPIQAWGGIEQFKKIQARDAEKIDLCAVRRMQIIYFTFQEELNEDLVRNRISELR